MVLMQLHQVDGLVIRGATGVNNGFSRWLPLGVAIRYFDRVLLMIYIVFLYNVLVAVRTRCRDRLHVNLVVGWAFNAIVSLVKILSIPLVGAEIEFSHPSVAIACPIWLLLFLLST